MDLAELKEIRHHADLVIKGAELWAPEFKKRRKLFKRLVTAQSNIELAMAKYFANLSYRVYSFVNWTEYQMELALAVKAASTHTITHKVSLNFGDDEENAERSYINLNISQDVVEATLVGALYGQVGAGIKQASITNTTDWIVNSAKEQIAEMVTQVSDTTRTKIADSIETSLQNGESVAEAVARLTDTINDPARAELIARTETVSAWGSGTQKFGEEFGATGKEWHTSGNPCPICVDNEADGEIPFDDSFSSGDDTVPAHPNCQCFVTLSLPDGSEQDS